MSILNLLPESLKRKITGLVIIIAALGWFAAAWYAHKPKEFCVGRCTRLCQDRCFARGYCPAATAD